MKTRNKKTTKLPTLPEIIDLYEDKESRLLENGYMELNADILPTLKMLGF
jgi:hypothetical protein